MNVIQNKVMLINEILIIDMSTVVVQWVVYSHVSYKQSVTASKLHKVLHM